MIVLGFDPGATTGWALLDCSAATSPRFIGGGGLRALEALVDIEIAKRPDVVAIECVEFVFSRQRFGASMATALVNAARVEGALTEVARSQRVNVETCTAAEWRAALVGSRTASDAVVKKALGLRVNLPRCNAHVRDAIGVALFCAERVRIERMKRAPKLAQGASE